MFNLKNLKLIKDLKNLNLQSDLIKFSLSQTNSEKRNEFLNSIITDNKFIQEDMKIRAMVEDMLKKEFSEDITKLKSYDFLVDSVVNRLKKNQLKNNPKIDLKQK